MAQELELLLKAKNVTDQAFKAAQDNVERLDSSVKDTSRSFDQMSGKAAQMSDTIGRTSTTLARSADAFGLNAQALRTLDDVMDVAELGFNNLSKSAAGFNAASVGVAGAGLAIGTAIGSWLNTFPQVRAAVDSLRDSVERLFTGMASGDKLRAATAGLKDWAAKMKAIDDQVKARSAAGVTDAQIAATVKEAEAKEKLAKASELAKTRITDLAQAERILAVAAAASSKATDKAADDSARKAEQVRAAFQKAAEDARVAWEKFYSDMAKRAELFLADWAKESNEAGKKRATALGVAAVQALEDEKKALEANVKAMGEMAEAWDDIRAAQDAAMAQAASDFANLLGSLAELAGGAQNGFGQILLGWQSGIEAALQYQAATTAAGKAQAALGAAMSAFKSGSAAGGAATGAIFGSQFGPVGAVLGGIGGAILGLFGGAKKAREEAERLRKELEKTRDEFIKSMGGMDMLKAKAKEAGVSLDTLFAAKSAEQLGKAIDDIKDKLDRWGEANDKLKEAMDKYGITVDQLGTKFSQQMLNEQALQLLESYKLLAAAGVDQGVIIEKMGADFNKYVQDSIKSGTAIPEAMRPIIEQMIAQGQLMDENGKAYTSAEEAGITYSKTMGEMFDTLLEKIEKLVDALLGIDDINVSPRINLPDGVTFGGGGQREEGGVAGDRSGRPRGFAGGGRITEWGVPAVLHGTPSNPEYVLTTEQLKAYAAAALSGATPGGGGGGGESVIHVVVSLDGRVLDERWIRQNKAGNIPVSPASVR